MVMVTHTNSNGGDMVPEGGVAVQHPVQCTECSGEQPDRILSTAVTPNSVVHLQALTRQAQVSKELFGADTTPHAAIIVWMLEPLPEGTALHWCCHAVAYLTSWYV